MNIEIASLLDSYAITKCNEFYDSEAVANGDDHACTISNIYRKLINTLLILMKNKKTIPDFYLPNSTLISYKRIDRDCLHDDDTILETAVSAALNLYGWDMPDAFNIRNNYPQIQDYEYYINHPEWFQNLLLQYIDDNSFFEEPSDDIKEKVESIVENEVILATFTNKKISKIIYYYQKNALSCDNEFLSLYSQLTEWLNIFLNPFTQITTQQDIIYDKEDVFYVSCYYAFYDNNGNYYDLELEKYFNPALIYFIKKIDEIADKLIKEYYIY